jgi:CDP-glucose 4,6-dehydratase
MAGKLNQDLVSNFFRGKRILITGHTGFKGSWLTYMLLRMGATVIGYSDRIPTNPSLFECLGLEKEIHHIIDDIRDLAHLSQVVTETKPELCFHLAAQPLVRLSYEDPMLTYSTNIIGSLHMLESIRLSDSIQTVVMITSDKCYENKEWDFGYRESDAMGGFDPYSSSKGCCELIISAYERSYFGKQGKGCASARAGNVIGGGDWSQDRLVVDVIKSLSMKQEILIRYPKATRPWQHVLDPLWGYLTLAYHLHKEPNQFSGPWNFGPIVTQNMTVEELVKKIIYLWRSGSYQISSTQTSHEAGKLALDIHKAVTLLDWYPRWNCEQAIEQTVLWYKEYYTNPTRDMRSLCEQQIRSYLATSL